LKGAKRKSRATIRIVAGALCVSYILSTLPTPLYVSTYLIACYCGTSIPVIGVGLVRGRNQPGIGGFAFCGTHRSLMTIVALLVEWKISPG
jgi:hypothetical protein